MQHPAAIAADESLAVGYLPDFPATGLVLLADGPVGDITIEAGDIARTFTPEMLAENLWQISWPEAITPDSIVLTASDLADWQIRGLTLINTTDQTFQPLVPGNYRLLHSGDVKLYENLDVLPRAFLVSNWQWAADADTAVTLMQSANFDPRETAMLLGEGMPVSESLVGETAVSIISYEPEQVAIQVESQQEALLLLTDAYYPGWVATINNEPLPIYQVDVLFRAIIIPVGQYTVTLSFSPQSFAIGRLLSIVGVFIWALLVIVIRIGQYPGQD